MKKIRKIAMLPMILLLAIAITAIPISINPVSTDSLQSSQTETIADSNVSLQASETTNTFTFYGLEQDVMLQRVGYPYSGAHNSLAADGGSIALLIVGQDHEYEEVGDVHTYWVYRSFVYYDTSPLPDDCILLSADLLLFCDFDNSDTEFDIVVQNGQPTYPHDPFQYGDYYYGYYSGNGGSLSTTQIVEGSYNTIPLNSDGLGWINKAGITKLCLRSSRDINSDTPSFETSEYVEFLGYELGVDTIPKLVVTYETVAPLTASISPVSVTMDVGDEQTFTCTASGGITPYNYQWLVNGENTGCTSNQYVFTAESDQIGTTVTIQCIVNDSPSQTATAEAQAYIKIPHGLIDTDELYGEKTRLCVELFHDGEEADPDWDYYAVRVTVEDPYIELPAHKPLYLTVCIEMPGFCQEFPANHQPQTGSYGHLPVSIAFSFYGIGFSVTPPAYYVYYSRQYQNGKLVMQWDVKPSKVFGIASGFLFYDYCSFAVGVRVPEGYKPEAQVYAEVAYYKRTYVVLVPVYYDKKTEVVSWAIVDPPGAEPITPIEPDSINAPENVTIISVNSVVLKDWNGQNKTTLRKGDGILIVVNYTWGLENSPGAFVMTMYDSSGAEVFFCGGWFSQMCVGTYTIEVGAYPGLPSWAHLGTATIHVTLYTDWPWCGMGGIECAPETVISIEIIS